MKGVFVLNNYRKSLFLALKRFFTSASVIFLIVFFLNGIITARAETRAMSFGEEVNRVPPTVKTKSDIILPLPRGQYYFPLSAAEKIKSAAKVAVYFLPAPIPNIYESYKAIEEYGRGI